MSDEVFPAAEISDQGRSRWAALSRMWLVTLACLIFAIGLTWFSLETPGVPIKIRFPEGHGLKDGDQLRHRGIDIGHVESVSLDSALGGIEVTAVLDNGASAIAAEGSRFWIVRPQVDFSGISGLETAVGAKYIAVIPGDGERSAEFDGVASKPPDPLDSAGIEIILRGADRYGVNPGSPLSWRGVEVGQVLSSNLSPDALHVDTRVRLREPYRKLLSRDSKFWVTSGIHVGLDLSGFEMSAESLATIAKGGIAFITPSSTSEIQPVRPGDVFALHEQRDDQWVDSAITINLMELSPPPIESVTATWTQKHFGISRTHESHTSALVIGTTERASVIFPEDVTASSSKADSFELVFQRSNKSHALQVPTLADSAEMKQWVVAVPLKQSQYTKLSLLDAKRIRVADGPEDCFVIRGSSAAAKESAVVIEMIGQDELTLDGDIWRCSNSKLSRDLWHGAAVVSSQDEKVIGMLVVTPHGPIVCRLPQP